MKNFENLAAKAQSIGYRLTTMYETVASWNELEPAVQRENMQDIPIFKQPLAHMMVRANEAFRSAGTLQRSINNLASTAESIAIQQYVPQGEYPAYNFYYEGEEYYLLRFLSHHGVLSGDHKHIDMHFAYGRCALWLTQAKSLHPMLVQLQTIYSPVEIPTMLGGTDSFRHVIQAYILGTLYDSIFHFNYDPDTIWVWQEPLLTADFLDRITAQHDVFDDILEEFTWST